jgi:NAD(P)-dependent dehydrogenase (short-subunit alcohol dehydrogenase family)
VTEEPIQAPVHSPQGPCFADLSGKVALVTGGGAGIGRGITRRLVAEGMRVYICGRTQQHLDETARAVEGMAGLAIPVATDVSQEHECEALLARVRQECGALDVLVHNAALVRGGSLSKTDTDTWRLFYATNVESAYFLARESAALMVARGRGAMVFISTIGALRLHHGMLAYDSSKCAVEGLARSLALELAPHRIRVNCVAPGATNREDFTEEVPAEALRQPYVPLGRKGTSAEMGAAVAFLASDQASYITGQVLCVDGGATTQLSPRGVFI